MDPKSIFAAYGAFFFPNENGAFFGFFRISSTASNSNMFFNLSILKEIVGVSTSNLASNLSLSFQLMFVLGAGFAPLAAGFALAVANFLFATYPFFIVQLFKVWYSPGCGTAY